MNIIFEMIFNFLFEFVFGVLLTPIIVVIISPFVLIKSMLGEGKYWVKVAVNYKKSVSVWLSYTFLRKPNQD